MGGFHASPIRWTARPRAIVRVQDLYMRDSNRPRNLLPTKRDRKRNIHTTMYGGYRYEGYGYNRRTPQRQSLESIEDESSVTSYSIEALVSSSEKITEKTDPEVAKKFLKAAAIHLPMIPTTSPYGSYGGYGFNNMRSATSSEERNTLAEVSTRYLECPATVAIPHV